MVTCVGEALIDFIPLEHHNHPGTPCFLPSPGGSPFNTAISLARLSVPTGFLGKLSRDFFGDMLADTLSNNGVDTSMLQRSDKNTTLAFVTRDDQGDARYAFFAEDSADRNLSVDELPEHLPGDPNSGDPGNGDPDNGHLHNGDLPTEEGALLFGSISTLMEPGASTIERLVERESARRVVSFDPNVRANLIPDREAYRQRFEHLVSHTSIVKISDDDLAWVYPDAPAETAARRLLRLGTRLVVLTFGAEGSLALTNTLLASAPAAATEVSDTIGAGDSFHGGFIAWLQHHDHLSRAGIDELTQEDLRQALIYAATVSGITCSRPGADPPRAAEVDAALP
jgi:fructokinase